MLCSWRCVSAIRVVMTPVRERVLVVERLSGEWILCTWQAGRVKLGGKIRKQLARRNHSFQVYT